MTWRRDATISLTLLCLLMVPTGARAAAADPGKPPSPTASSDPAAAILRAATAFRALSVGGGYCGIYALDSSERWGESFKQKAAPGEIWIQPPGTPSVGEAYLAAWRATGQAELLAAARDTGRALAWTQRLTGGWDHLCDVSGLTSETTEFPGQKGYCTFDDNISQGALTYLIHLDAVLDEPWLTAAVERGIGLFLQAQDASGGWPQWFPLRGGYHDHFTFNDGAMNDCIRVMLLAHTAYGRADCLDAVRRCGEFILRSQGPAEQAGWAQQYDRELRPAWARAFEPPAYSSLSTTNNIRTLIDLRLILDDERYLAPIPAALEWLERSKIGDNLWARLYEVGTNRPIYGDRDSKIHYTLEEISEERRTGYGWQGEFGVASAKARFEKLREQGPGALPRPDATPRPVEPKALAREAERALERARPVIEALDAQGLWTREGHVYSGDFVKNLNALSRAADLARQAASTQQAAGAR